MKHIVKTSIKFILSWIQEYLTDKQFILFSSIVVGISSALAVIILKTFASYILTSATLINTNFHFKFLLIILPIIGLLLTVLFVNVVLKNKFEKGTSNILYSILKKSSIVAKYQIYAQIITSGFTVGMGGSAGLESPIVLAGAAIGSNYANFFQLTYKNRTLLLACGVAAGISAAFNAPIAGVLFVTEILLIDISISSFIPLILASASGALFTSVLLDENILLSFKQQQQFDYRNVPFYILLGLLSGVMTFYYTRVFSKIENLFEEYKVNMYLKVLVGSLLLVGLIYIVPSLFGEGYESIKDLAAPNASHRILDQTIFSSFADNPWTIIIFIGLGLFLKAIATGLTIGSGGNGGSFAPSLFMGAYLGFLFSTLINMLGWTHELPVNNFTIVGMAGMLSGIFHAPLTAIFLIGEITGGYELMIPLMIIASISFAISKNLDRHSLELKKLAHMGHVFTGIKDTDLLSNIEASTLIQTNIDTVDPDATLGELIKTISTSSHSIFPVVSKEGQIKGVIYLDNIRKIMFEKNLYDTLLVKNIMEKAKELIEVGETIDVIMQKFDKSDTWYLPVADKGAYVGIISKSNLLATYRTQLISTSID